VSFSCSRHAVIRVYDEAANVIETHEYKGDFKEWCNTVFGWTATRFRFHTSSAKKVTPNQNSCHHSYRQSVFRCRSFSKRSKIKPEKPSSRLCCVEIHPVMNLSALP
jgi:hypothetical protein